VPSQSALVQFLSGAWLRIAINIFPASTMRLRLTMGIELKRHLDAAARLIGAWSRSTSARALLASERSRSKPTGILFSTRLPSDNRRLAAYGDYR
jgi:hypothetical protein